MMTKSTYIIIAVIAYLIFTSTIGTIVVYNGNVGVLNDSLVTFLNGKKVNTAFLTKYYYFGADKAGVKTNTATITTVPLKPGCYTYIGMGTAVEYNGHTATYSFSNGYLIYPALGVAAVIYPGEGVIFTDIGNLIPVPFKTSDITLLDTNSYVVRGGWTVYPRGDSAVISGKSKYTLSSLSSCFTVPTT